MPVPSNIYTSQIVEIATSPYAEAVTVETLQDLEVKAMLTRSGYTIAADGTVLSPYSALTASGTAMNANAVVEATVTTDVVEGTTTLSTAAPAATTTEAGTAITKGAAAVNVSPLMYVLAVAYGAHLGYKSYKEYPEFWTDLSNTIFTKDVNDPRLINTTQFLMRVLDEGGVATYCEKKRVEETLSKMWEMGLFNPQGGVMPAHDYSGNYVLNQPGHTHGITDSLMILPEATGYVPSEGQIQYVKQIADDEIGSITIQQYRVNNNRVFRVIGWDYLPEAVNVVKDEYGRYVNIVPATGAIKWVYELFDNGLTSRIPVIAQSDTTLNGQYGENGAPVIWSDTDGTFIPENDAVLYDEDHQYPLTEAELLAILDDWAEDGFTINKIGPDGTVTPTDYIPLKIDKFDPDVDHVPTDEIEEEVKSGKQPVNPEDPDRLPDWIPDIFKPTPTTPDVPGTPEVSHGSTPVIVPPSNSISSKLYTVYNPSNSKLDDLGGYLWDTNIVTELVKLFTNNPLDAIISLHQVYVTPHSTTSKNIILGSLNSGITAPVVDQQYIELDCGSVFIPEIYEDARDYTATDCQIFLPFISYRTLDPHDVVNCTVRCHYTIDVYTGSCLAQLYVTKDGVEQCLYTFEGNCSVQIPLTAAQRNGIMSLITSGAMAIGGALTANPAMLAQGVASGVTAIAGGAAKSSIQRTSGFSGNAGAMGIKTPFIILTRSKSADASQFNRIIGNPTNRTVVLGNCSGFVKVKECHVENIKGATAEELNMIESLLKGGIII